MIPLFFASWASGAELRSAAEDAEARRDWPAALAAWEKCAVEAPDRDARYCAIRLEALAPQAADAFAGWDILEGVRREYRTLGSDPAIARIEAALGAAPDGPAAPAMRLWLANERNRRGEKSEVARIGVEMAADARTPAAALGFVAGIDANDRQDARRRAVGLAGAGVGAAYAAVAALRKGPLKWRSAALAGLALGGVPTLFAAVYEENVWDGFARAALVVSVSVLLAGRAPPWAAIPGTVGALVATAWWNDWYPSLGF